MIKFFRRIRYDLMDKNKTGKYLKYAVGEIILVVIGILIALQINNANELRKTKNKEQAILQNLVQDLKADSLSFERNLKTLKEIKSLHEDLYEIGIKKNENIIIENPNYIRRLLFYNPITKENDPFIASKISDDEIRNEILIYFRNIKDMNDSYGEFEEVIQQRMRPFLGAKGVQNLSAWFENSDRPFGSEMAQNVIDPDQLRSLSKDVEFQQLLLESSIKCEEAYGAVKILIQQNNNLKETVIKNLE